MWLDLTKAFHIAELSTMFALPWIVYHQGMEWNDSCITTLPSPTLVLPCNQEWAKRVSASHFVLHHFCCEFMAFCSAAVPIKGLILARESVRNSSSIDGTRPNIGFFALSSQHHTSRNVNTIARFLAIVMASFEHNFLPLHFQ